MTKTVKIKVIKDGPYSVSGNPELKEQVIVPNSEGASWEYKDAKKFESKEEMLLCRCGHSKNPPYCDGSHMNADDFDGTCTASHEPILNNAEIIKGPNLTLYDNEDYCAFARFCDAGSRVWNLVDEGTEESDKLAIRETLNCPAGRLLIKDNKTGEFLEEQVEPSISVLEDPTISASGPLYLKGGIEVIDENNTAYEIRNRQTLCRCGQSSNKPFCDGTHASMHFNDGEITSRKTIR